MTRFLLKTLWWTSIFSHTPQYLYFKDDMFEVGCYSSAKKYKWEFTEEEVIQLYKDYDMSMFIKEYIGEEK